ncbi:MAG: 50S ribosome-binding GTPase [Aphanocapsa lilacina HA4352-LM1]|jgi:hypothetical protein|nr:50S ribosome-binding GTPase [Aphanocapsa lilacina HA4352-LM1]
MPDQTGDVVKVTKTAIEFSEAVLQILKERGVLDKVFDVFLGKEHVDILVLGATGVGKSAFINALRGQSSLAIASTRENQDIQGILRGVVFNIVDTPGQVADKEIRARAIREATRKKYVGIINIVCNGYHESEAPDLKSRNVAEALVDGEPSPEYLRSCRKREIDALEEWTILLGGYEGAKWLVTVVTKADLWLAPSTKQDVLNHYAQGPYEQALGEAKALRRIVCSYSSTNRLFFQRAAMSGFYTDEQRFADHNALVATILAYCANR